MTRHRPHRIGGHDNETATFDAMTSDGRCRLVCEYRGKALSAEADDYFEALVAIRPTLEREGLVPYCYGASLDIAPSAMSRQMSEGRAAYRLAMEKAASRKKPVRILDEGADVIPSTVARQRAYFEDWMASLRA